MCPGAEEAVWVKKTALCWRNSIKVIVHDISTETIGEAVNCLDFFTVINSSNYLYFISRIIQNPCNLYQLIYTKFPIKETICSGFIVGIKQI